MIVADGGQDDCFADCWVLIDFAVPSVWRSSFRHRTSYGESLIDKSDHGLRDRNHFLCGRDRCPRRCEDGLHHADHGLDSGDHGLLEREDVPDRGDHFPGPPEDSLRLCNHCLRPSEICRRRADIFLRR